MEIDKMRRSKYIGQVFNNLEILDTLIETNEKGTKRQYFIVKCTKCGTVDKKDRFTLLKGESRCKCSYKFERHDATKNERLYNIWCNMKKRCYNKNTPRYRLYGGRGIEMCDEWKESYNAFYDWAIRNGYNEDLSIDRIDVNGNYEPMNCRWATQREQCNNQRKNHMLTHNGKTQSVSAWARELNINRGTLASRINTYGWSVAEALEDRK